MREFPRKLLCFLLPFVARTQRPGELFLKDRLTDACDVEVVLVCLYNLLVYLFSEGNGFLSSVVLPRLRAGDLRDQFCLIRKFGTLGDVPFFPRVPSGNLEGFTARPNSSGTKGSASKAAAVSIACCASWNCVARMTSSISGAVHPRCDKACNQKVAIRNISCL